MEYSVAYLDIFTVLFFLGNSLTYPKYSSSISSYIFFHVLLLYLLIF